MTAPATGQKFDGGKLRYDLADPIALAWLVATLTYGVAKYAANNWRRFEPAELRERYGAALLRHFEAWRAGEELDEETGFPHIAMVQFSAMVLTATFARASLAEVRATTHEAIQRWREREGG
jgi:hypothetical protein